MATDFSFLESLQFVQRSLAYLVPNGSHPHQFAALNNLAEYIEEEFKPHYRGLMGGIEPEVKDKGGKVKLAVPYYNQLDNNVDVFGPGGRQCNTTCCAMLCDYLTDGALSAAALERGEKEPEAVYDNYVAQFGDTTSHEAQTKALKKWGIESYWETKMTRSRLIAELEAGIPTVIGVRYKKGGHILIVVGHNPDEKFFWVHDPFGVRQGASNVYDNTKSGAYDRYSYGLIDEIWGARGNPLVGWGRVVSQVRAAVPAPLKTRGMLA